MKLLSVLLLSLLVLTSTLAQDDGTDATTTTTTEPSADDEVTDATTTTQAVPSADDPFPDVDTVEDIPNDDGDAGESKCQNATMLLGEGTEDHQVRLTIVDNFLDFKNHTDPSNLKRSSLPDLIAIFGKSDFWRLDGSGHFVYPVLIRVAIEPTACHTPLIKSISVQVAQEKEASIKIDEQWYKFVSPAEETEVFSVTLAHPAQRDFFEIYLDLESESEGGLKGLEVALCCEEE